MNIYRLLSGVAILCLVVALYLTLTGNLAQAGPFFIGFFIALAISFRGSETLKGFTYTTIIFAAVTTALYYPGYFQEFNGFKFAILITPLIQIIMFGMGTSMSFEDFVGVVKMPRGVNHAAFRFYIGQHQWVSGRNCSRNYPDRLFAQWYGFQCNIVSGKSKPCLIHYDHSNFDHAGPLNDAYADEVVRRRVYRD
jgi:hypothetical protein